MTVDPIRNLKDIKRLKDYVFSKNQPRNYLMLILGYHSFLRIGDLLKLKIEDIYNFKNKTIRPYIELKENKTDKRNRIALNKECKAALDLYFASLGNKNFLGERYLFWNNREGNKPISEHQAYILIKGWCIDLELAGNFACHSLRKTKPYQIFMKHKKDMRILVLIMQALNHSSIKQTLRYLGITQDEIDYLHIVDI